MGVLFANVAGVWQEVAGTLPAAPPSPPSTDAGNSITAGADGGPYFNFPTTYDELAALAAAP